MDAQALTGLQAALDKRRRRLKSKPDLTVRALGLSDYAETWRKMRRATDRRDDASQDELWLLEHPRAFTLGQAGRIEHVLTRAQFRSSTVIAADR